MGCWNETCGITQLAIRHNDKVRCFILIKQEFGSSFGGGGGSSYINEIWNPLGPGILGKYDDYGGLDSIKEDYNAQLLLDKLKGGWVGPSENDEEETPVLDNLTLDNAIKRIERGKAFFKKSGFKETELGLMFVLENVYQAMMKYNPIEVDFGQPKFLYKPFKEIFKSKLFTWYSEALDLRQSLSKEQGEDRSLKLMLRLCSTGDDVFDNWRDYSEKSYKQLLMNKINDQVPLEDPTVQQICNSVFESMIFNKAMSKARKFWHPQTGKGSQDCELDIYKIINKASDAVINARIELDLKEGGEVQDKNGYYPYMIEHNKEVQCPKKKKK